MSDEAAGKDSGKPTQRNDTTGTISYTAERVIGNGSFGVVFQAKVVGTGEVVAIKKVLQDRRFKNRELQIMRLLNHTNIVSLKHCFYSSGRKADEVYLNLVMEYLPETVYRVARHYAKLRQSIPIIHVQLFTYQLARSLACLHRTNICHRDIKPQNLLIDPHTDVLKLCDFGSAKKLVEGEPNVSYICSRYYRAPELIFGTTNYSTKIDLWSTGCVLAEFLINQPLFPGESGVDQLVEIIKVLGTPSRESIRAMNKHYTDFKFPQIKAHPLTKVFRSRTPPEAVDLASKLLVYDPALRLSAWETCAHEFFDPLRVEGQKLPNGRPFPSLFDFSQEEIDSMPPELVPKLIPEWAKDSGKIAAAEQSASDFHTDKPAIELGSSVGKHKIFSGSRST